MTSPTIKEARRLRSPGRRVLDRSAILPSLAPVHWRGEVKVWIDVGDSTAELGVDGIILHIADNSGTKVGRLRIGKAKVEWLPGKIRKPGHTITLEKLIADLGKLPRTP